MKIYKIASTESNISDLKESIRILKSDVKDVKKDCKDVTAKVKKIDEILDKLNIGTRRITQMQNSYTELQRKIEKFEVVMQEWKNYKKEMNSTIRTEVERKTRGQVAADSRIYNHKTALLRQPQNFYDVYAVSGGDKTFLMQVPAYSERQAVLRAHAAGKTHDYREVGWVIKAYLNKEKTQENMNKYKEVKEYQALLEEQKKKREEIAQEIYGG
jgi:hypothetical protein